MGRKGKNSDYLYHQIPLVEHAIAQGQAIEICRQTSADNKNHLGMMQVLFHHSNWQNNMLRQRED